MFPKGSESPLIYYINVVLLVFVTFDRLFTYFVIAFVRLIVLSSGSSIEGAEELREPPGNERAEQ